MLLNAGCFAFPLCGTCEAFLRAVRLAELVCVSWGSVCLSPLLAGSRGLGTSISMLIRDRCGMLNQVLRGNSGPSRREKPQALWGGLARHNKIFPALLPLLLLLLHWSGYSNLHSKVHLPYEWKESELYYLLWQSLQFSSKNFPVKLWNSFFGFLSILPPNNGAYHGRYWHLILVTIPADQSIANW